MRPDEGGPAGDDAGGTATSSLHDGTGDNTVLLEATGFTILLDDIDGSGDEKRQIILARS
jgi:hypothetical protein